MINKDERGKIDCNFGGRPAPFMLFILLVMCSVEKNSPSRIGPRGFWAETNFSLNLLKPD